MPEKILVIDDSPEIQALVKVRLSKEQVVVHCANDGASGLTAARKLQPDVILLDVDMPHRDGFATCADLKADSITMDIPIIFLTGASSTEDKIRGLELGATDYVTKPFDPAELQARVRSSLRTRYLMELLAKKAMIDGLTGLWNRTYLDAHLQRVLSSAQRRCMPLSCIMADVDHFKSINDTYGHSFGDEVLREIAKIFSECCRQEDIVCRYGGEEFTVLLPSTPLSGATDLAERIRKSIETRPFLSRNSRLQITCSFGVSNLQESIPPSIIELADDALYNAKRSGRNRVEVHGEPQLIKA